MFSTMDKLGNIFWETYESRILTRILKYCLCLHYSLKTLFEHAQAGRQCFSCWKHLKTCGQTRKHCFRNKNVFEFVGKHFCFLENKFCFRNNVSRGERIGKHWYIDRKHNVSATMFPSLPRAWILVVLHDKQQYMLRGVVENRVSLLLQNFPSYACIFIHALLALMMIQAYGSKCLQQ